MPDLNLAEAILSLFTPPDTAACIAGDFAGEFAPQGSVRFWTHVLRTAFALFRQQIMRRPYRVSALVLAGFVLTQIAVSGIIPSTLSMDLGWHPLALGEKFLAMVLSLLDSIVEPLLIGLAIARFSRGSEMTTCGLLAAFLTAFSIVLGSFGVPEPIVWHFLQWNVIAGFVFVLCGAVIRLRA